MLRPNAISAIVPSCAILLLVSAGYGQGNNLTYGQIGGFHFTNDAIATGHENQNVLLAYFDNRIWIVPQGIPAFHGKERRIATVHVWHHAGLEHERIGLPLHTQFEGNQEWTIIRADTGDGTLTLYVTETHNALSSLERHVFDEDGNVIRRESVAQDVKGEMLAIRGIGADSYLTLIYDGNTLSLRSHRDELEEVLWSRNINERLVKCATVEVLLDGTVAISRIEGEWDKFGRGQARFVLTKINIAGGELAEVSVATNDATWREWGNGRIVLLYNKSQFPSQEFELIAFDESLDKVSAFKVADVPVGAGRLRLASLEDDGHIVVAGTLGNKLWHAVIHPDVGIMSEQSVNPSGNIVHYEVKCITVVSAGKVLVFGDVVHEVFDPAEGIVDLQHEIPDPKELGFVAEISVVSGQIDIHDNQ